MPAFEYRALDRNGRAHRGVVEANNQTGAREAMRERNLFPLSLTASSKIGQRQRYLDIRWFFDSLSIIGPRQLALITRQLATLVGSDVRIEDALKVVVQRNTSTRVASTLLSLRSAILDGRTFASALSDHPKSFPEFYCASVSAGEQSGKLPAVLVHLADFVEKRQQNWQKIQLAMLYPALLAIVATAIVTMLLAYIVPGLARVFANRGADLPWLTRGLIGLSDAVRAYGWLLVAVLCAAIVLGRRWLAEPTNQMRLHYIISHQWPIADFSRQLNSAQFAGTLATLVLSGVPLFDALSTAAAVTPNRFIRAQIEAAKNRVGEGTSLRQALAQAQCLTPMLIAVVASGEAGGNLGHALARAAADQQRDLDAWVSTLVALVEPAVLLLMGGFVLMIVLAILQPIMNLNNLVGTPQ